MNPGIKQTKCNKQSPQKSEAYRVLLTKHYFLLQTKHTVGLIQSGMWCFVYSFPYL